MRTILVLPRAEVRYLIENKKPVDHHWALISIYTSPKERLVTPLVEKELKKQGCDKVLNMCFGDYDKNVWDKIKGTKEAPYFFNQKQAQEIIEFVKFFDEKHQLMSYTTTLVVHCDAGVSRSGAVGLWACRYLGRDEKEFRKLNKNIHPNSHVYDTLYEVSGMKGDYRKFWDKVLIEGSNPLTAKIRFLDDEEDK